ncbi:MAG: hypothetical protein AB7V22_11345, partial [Kiritimatiellia bacterium]
PQQNVAVNRQDNNEKWFLARNLFFAKRLCPRRQGGMGNAGKNPFPAQKTGSTGGLKKGRTGPGG